MKKQSRRKTFAEEQERVVLQNGHSRQSSTDDFITSGAYVDHRSHGDGRKNIDKRRHRELPPSTRRRELQFPLTNRNLQNLLGQNPVTGAVALDMDQFAQEQRQLAQTQTLSNPFETDADENFSINLMEFGGLNPSLDHLSDLTSLDDVCFPDYYDQSGRDELKDVLWPDIKVLEEFIREELEEEEEEVYAVNFEYPVARAARDESLSPTGRPLSILRGDGDKLHQTKLGKKLHQTNVSDQTNSRNLTSVDEYHSDHEDAPLLNHHATEVESLNLDALKVRPTPIQPWEKSREEIPTILNRKNKQQKDATTCRFTYFREDLDKTIHAPTISGLLAEEEQRYGDKSEEIAPRLMELFLPQHYGGEVDSLPDKERLETPAPLAAPMVGTPSGLSVPVPSDLRNSGSVPAPSGPPSDIGEIRSPPPFWLDVLDPSEEEMKVLSKTFGIHPLTTEDIFLGEAREKVELFKTYYFVCFTSFDIVYERRKQRAKEQEKKMNKLDEFENTSGFELTDFGDNRGLWGKFRDLVLGTSTSRRLAHSQAHSRDSVSLKLRSKKIREGELLPLNMYMIVFHDAVITFHFSPTPHPINVRRRARLLSDYLTVTSDWICYALIDDITDSFAPMIDSIEDEVNLIEDAILRMHAGEDSDSDSDLDDEALHDDGLQRLKLRRRKAGGVQEVFFRRPRSKLTVENSLAPKLRRKSLALTRSGSASSSSKSTGIISWKRKGDMLRRIGECRKRVMSVLRLLGSKADVVKGFSKRYLELMQEHGRTPEKLEIGMYLGDIQDHIVTMVQSLNHYEKLIARFHSNYLAQINIDMTKVNNDTNDVLGKITILGTVVLPINVVTGLWGMNCLVPGQDYDGLAWFWGIIFFMLCFSTAAYNYARRFTGL